MIAESSDIRHFHEIGDSLIATPDRARLSSNVVITNPSSAKEFVYYGLILLFNDMSFFLQGVGQFLT